MNCIKLLGAINKNTGKYTPPRFASKNDKYKCPECERDLIFRQGKIKVPHYAHKKENDPCKFYINPTETQIHKDAKLLLKSIIENNMNVKIKRNCICCNNTINEFIIPQYNENFKINIEYKIKHEGKIKYIDIAYIDNNNFIALFEICYRKKSCKQNRPEPWYEIDAEKFIDIVNKNTNINELTIECIRKEKCIKCITDIDQYNIKHNEAKEKLAKMIPYDNFFTCRDGPFIDYPIHNNNKYFGVLLDEIINIEHIKKYIPKNIYNSIEDKTDKKINILSNPEIIKYIPNVPQVFDSNFVPSFELCEEIGLYPFMEVDIAIPHKGDIVEVWMLSQYDDYDLKFIISKILRYIINCSIYIINKDWILEQNNNLSKEDFYNNAKKVAKCFKIKPIEFRNTNISFDFTNIYLKVPFYQKDKAKSLGAKWDCNNKLWFIKHDNKKKEYILSLFNQIDLKYKDLNETEISKTIEKIILNVKDWGILLKNPNIIEFLKYNFDKINCEYLLENHQSIELLSENLDILTIDWDELSSNPNAIELLKQNQDKINWERLSTNLNAIDLLKQNPDKIDWETLAFNHNSEAIILLKQNPDKINWEILSSNPNAIELLKENQDKINWKFLSSNPNAIQLLKDNQDKIDWFELSFNSNAIKLLKQIIFE